MNTLLSNGVCVILKILKEVLLMDNESFRKGEEFEKFVENNLFAESDYTLIHRTNNYSQNKIRFSENTLMPDFKFRCKKTLKEFYIEVKYRSNFNANNKISVISFPQLERFRKIQNTENVPVYIVIGYGGSPSNPDELSLIPIDELAYLELYPSFLKNYKINSSNINIELLNVNNTANGKQKVVQKTRSFKKISIAVGVVLIAMASLVGFYSFQEDIESELKRKTAEYYKNIEIGNIDVLGNYIAPKVNRWYDKSDLTLEQIITETSNYVSKYPKSSTDIRWETFEIEELGDDYLCTYKLVYKIKSKGKFKDKVFHLKIDAVWGKDLKIKSISEQRL